MYMPAMANGEMPAHPTNNKNAERAKFSLPFRAMVRVPAPHHRIRILKAETRAIAMLPVNGGWKYALA